jgi:hypothetical protein
MHQLGKGEVSEKAKCEDDVQFIDKRSARNHRNIRLELENAAYPRAYRIGYAKDQFHSGLIKPDPGDNNQEYKDDIIIRRAHGFYLRDEDPPHQRPHYSIEKKNSGA